MGNSNEPTKFEDLKPFSPLEVRIEDGRFEDAVKRWKSMVQKSQILSVYKEKQSYEKPSDKKRRKRRETAERLRVAKIKEQQMANGEWEKKQKAKDKKRKERHTRKQEERKAQGS